MILQYFRQKVEVNAQSAKRNYERSLDVAQ